MHWEGPEDGPAIQHCDGDYTQHSICLSHVTPNRFHSYICGISQSIGGEMGERISLVTKDKVRAFS